MHLAFEVGLLVVGCEMRVGYDEEVALGVGDPFVGGWLWCACEIWVKEVGRMLLVADILMDP